MAFDDLDLEFEDEEEVAKKKKSEAVQVDVDLQFSSPADKTASRPMPNLLKASAAATPAATPLPGKAAATPMAKPVASVTKIDEARAAKPAVAAPTVARAANTPSPLKASAPRSAGSSALQADQYDLEGQEILDLREQLRRTEFEADVKVAVAEFKTDILSELLSDTKLMQHQVEQLLVRINAKHPDMKQEVLMIKKILADFNAKKRK